MNEQIIYEKHSNYSDTVVLQNGNVISIHQMRSVSHLIVLDFLELQQIYFKAKDIVNTP